MVPIIEFLIRAGSSLISHHHNNSLLTWSYWTSDTGITVASTMVSAVVGALIGGIISGFSSWLVANRSATNQLQRDRDRAAEEDRKTAEERLIFIVMATMRIQTDGNNIRQLIAWYKNDAPQDSELWRHVHTLQFTSTINPDVRDLQPLARLGSIALVTTAMHLYGEYPALVDTVKAYNRLRTEHVERTGVPDDPFYRKTRQREKISLTM